MHRLFFPFKGSKMKYIFLLCLAYLFSGCASYIALPQDTTRAAHNRIKKQVKEGLIVAAEDYSEYRRARRYFYRDMVDLGYIPIYVCIGNQSESEFTVRNEKITLRFEDGTEAKAADFKEVIDRAQLSGGTAFFGFLLGIAPGFFMLSSINNANDALDQDYSKKAFRDSHIRRGDNLFGFLFFKAPARKRIASLKDATLEVNADKKAEPGQQGETFKFLVSIDAE